MSRSVSVPSGAEKVAYAVMSPDDDSLHAFDEAIEDAVLALMSKRPSLEACSYPVGREGQAIAENAKCFVVVSEYCGLVSVACVPKAKRFADYAGSINLYPAAACFGESLIKLGTLSNGEAVFRPADNKPSPGSGLGYSSKEGWL
jgi:hypothetical protein